MARRVRSESAHVAGHSYCGLIGIQLALDAPEAVHSLALFEPALLTGPAGQAFAEGAGPIVDLYQGGHPEVDREPSFFDGQRALSIDGDGTLADMAGCQTEILTI